MARTNGHAEVKDREQRPPSMASTSTACSTSADSVVRYLDTVDPAATGLPAKRYGSLTPWQRDPVAYGRAVVTGRFESCETEVVKVLVDL